MLVSKGGFASDPCGDFAVLFFGFNSRAEAKIGMTTSIDVDIIRR